MSNDSIDPGPSADAYALDDTEPSVATSEQSDREAALAANEYPYESESVGDAGGYPSGPADDDPSSDYVDSASYDGGLADIGLADPEIEQVIEESDFDPGPSGPEAAMPPIRPGDLPQPPEPGPDIPQPQVPGTAEPRPPARDPESPQPPLRREALDSELPKGTLMVVACGVAALLALEFISIAIVLGLSDLVGLPWSMLTVGTTWFVAAAAFGLASGTTPARRGALPEAVDSLTLTGLRGRLA